MSAQTAQTVADAADQCQDRSPFTRRVAALRCPSERQFTSATSAVNVPWTVRIGSSSEVPRYINKLHFKYHSIVFIANVFSFQLKLCIFRTGNGRGWGLKTVEAIKKNSFVIEYVGEVITNEEAEKRGVQYGQFVFLESFFTTSPYLIR